MCVTLVNKGLINPTDDTLTGACRCELIIDGLVIKFTHKRVEGLARGLRQAAHALEIAQTPDSNSEPCLKGL